MSKYNRKRIINNFNDFKKNYQGYNSSELINYYKEYLMSQRGGTFLCNPRIAFISKKKLKFIKPNDELKLVIILSESKKITTCLEFNVVLLIEHKNIGELGDKLEINIRDIPSNEIIKLDDTESDTELNQNIKRWILSKREEIDNTIGKHCHNKKIMDCISGVNQELFDGKLKSCQDQIKYLQPIEIPSQVDKTCNKSELMNLKLHSDTIKPIKSVPKIIKKDEDFKPSESDFQPYDLSDVTSFLPKSGKIDIKGISEKIEGKLGKFKDHVRKNSDEFFIPQVSYLEDFTGNKKYKYLYPKRVRVFNKDWKKTANYHPPFFSYQETNKDSDIIPKSINPILHDCLTTDSKSLGNKYLKYWADPLDINLIPFTSEDIKDKFPWNQSYCIKNSILKVPISERKSKTGKLEFNGKFPLNPNGRTGLAGKGCLPRWGPNQCLTYTSVVKEIDTQKWYLTIQYQKDENKLSLPTHLLLKDNLDKKNHIHILKGMYINFLDNIDKKILLEHFPNKLVTKLINEHTVEDNEEPLYYNYKKYDTPESKKAYQAIEIILEMAFEYKPFYEKLYNGVWVDPKNTDNSWLESSLYLLNFNERNPIITIDYWKILINLYFYSLRQNPIVSLYEVKKIKDYLQFRNPYCEMDTNIKCLKKIEKFITLKSKEDAEKINIQKQLYNKNPTIYLDFLNNVRKANHLDKLIQIEKEKISQREKEYIETLQLIKSDTELIVNEKYLGSSVRENVKNIQNLLNCEEDTYHTNTFKEKSICKSINNQHITEMRNKHWFE